MILELFAESSPLFYLPREGTQLWADVFIKQITAGDLICLLSVRPAVGPPVYLAISSVAYS